MGLLVLTTTKCPHSLHSLSAFSGRPSFFPATCDTRSQTPLLVSPSLNLAGLAWPGSPSLFEVSNMYSGGGVAPLWSIDTQNISHFSNWLPPDYLRIDTFQALACLQALGMAILLTIKHQSLESDIQNLSFIRQLFAPSKYLQPQIRVCCRFGKQWVTTTSHWHSPVYSFPHTSTIVLSNMTLHYDSELFYPPQPARLAAAKS